MPPLMFGGWWCSCCSANPVAFTLAALGFTFGSLPSSTVSSTLSYLQAIPLRIFGNVLSNEASPGHPVLHLRWAPCSSAAALPKTCWTRWAELFGPIRAAWAIRSLLSLHPRRHHRNGRRQVIAMAMISMPVMIRYGIQHSLHDRRSRRIGDHHAAGAAVAGVIVLADPAVSVKIVGDMYLGAWGRCDLPDRAVRRLQFVLGIFQASRRARTPRSSIPTARKEHVHPDSAGAVAQVPARASFPRRC